MGNLEPATARPSNQIPLLYEEKRLGITDLCMYFLTRGAPSLHKSARVRNLHKSAGTHMNLVRAPNLHQSAGTPDDLSPKAKMKRLAYMSCE